MNDEYLIFFILVIFISGCASQINQNVGIDNKIRDKIIKFELKKEVILLGNISNKPNSTFISDGYESEFKWNYLDKEWTLRIPLNEKQLSYYRGRDRNREFDLFVSDLYDDLLIKQIADAFNSIAKENVLSKEQIPFLVVSFVQSLPFTTDDETAGFDDYPRFPYETLVEGGGDCEDTSILAVSLLNELGFGTVLVLLPNHMGVGIKCNADYSGFYFYEYRGEKYCYLETTGENWDIGKMPEIFIDQKTTLIPVIKRPELSIKFTSELKFNEEDSYVDVDYTIMNLGSELAKDVKVYVRLKGKNETVFDEVTVNIGDVIPENGFKHKVRNLHVDSGEDFRVSIVAVGTNTKTDEFTGNWKE